MYCDIYKDAVQPEQQSVSASVCLAAEDHNYNYGCLYFIVRLIK